MDARENIEEKPREIHPADWGPATGWGGPSGRGAGGCGSPGPLSGEGVGLFQVLLLGWSLAGCAAWQPRTAQTCAIGRGALPQLVPSADRLALVRLQPVGVGAGRGRWRSFAAVLGLALPFAFGPRWLLEARSLVRARLPAGAWWEGAAARGCSRLGMSLRMVVIS